MANVMYSTARANATFDTTRKSGELQLEDLAEKYSKMKPELEVRGISLASVFNNQLKTLTSNYTIRQRNVYMNPVGAFMSKYHELNNGTMKMIIKKQDGRTMVAPVRGNSLEQRFERESQQGIVGGDPSTSKEALAEYGQGALEQIEVFFEEVEPTKTALSKV
jgi:hypothetical protein